MGTADGDWLTLEGSSFSDRSFSTVWAVALATYGVGDVVTTISIVYFVPAFTEANPAIRWAIQSFGGGGFLGLKLLVIYACLGVSIWGGVLDEDPLLFYGPPALLTVMGLAVTGFNLALLFS